MTSYSFNSRNTLEYKTLITQEMLKKGYLATNSIYVCKDHSQNVVKRLLKNLQVQLMKKKRKKLI